MGYNTYSQSKTKHFPQHSIDEYTKAHFTPDATAVPMKHTSTVTLTLVKPGEGEKH